MSDILLITPPFTQLNTPYPATAYLKGFLNTKGFSSFQMDLGIEVILSLFSKQGLSELFQIVNKETDFVIENSQQYLKAIDQCIQFLQGKNEQLKHQILSGHFLPQGPRFDHFDPTDWSFENMSEKDQAKHMATLYLEDIGDFICTYIDPNFGFSRYAEKLGRSANSFDELESALKQESSYIDDIAWNILKKRIENENCQYAVFSVPFPGNLYAAFRMAKNIRTSFPDITCCLGGGFPNTELRDLKEAKVFDYFHYISLDDGELPLELIIKNNSLINERSFKRTYYCVDNEVIYNNSSQIPDYQQHEIGTPDYSDLRLSEYISVIEIANPMHSLWSDGRWNKLTMAHGCYWGKCTFCDTSLPYIKDYEVNSAKLLVDRMEILIQQTGENSFHFVDEAAPPKIMKALASEIIKRDLEVRWWTNVRFEKSFTKELCLLLSASGCIAVSGGLEVASDRLLKLIDKGITVEQVAKVCDHFTQAQIMVHAYLMYAYPTQTVQETIDSLELVRQLFDQGVIQSAYWHQFALTAHSPIGKAPEQYGLTVEEASITFANNDIVFTDNTGIKHEQFHDGLNAALYNYMHDNAFEIPVEEWFEFEVPRTTVQPHFIENCLKN